MLLWVFVAAAWGQTASGKRSGNDLYSCLEECQTYQAQRERAYDECVEAAENLADRFSVVRHKQHCRERRVTISCDGLPPCQKPTPKETKLKEGIRLSNLALMVQKADRGQSNSNRRFYGGQTVWLRYDLQVAKANNERYFFDQDLKIIDAAGKEIFYDRAVLEKEVGMSSIYHLTTSFHLPKEFSAGNYRLSLRVKERLSAWEAVAESDFEVLRSTR